MGLFGYGKRDFVRNSVFLEIKIDEISKKALEEGVTLFPSADKLRAAVERVCPKEANFKKLDLIDERMFDLVKKLESDVQSKSSFALSAHAAILLSLLREARLGGVKAPEDFAVSYEDRFAECGAKIESLIAERDKTAEQLSELVARAELNKDDHVLVAAAKSLKDRADIVKAQIAPYIGQLNSFVEQLRLCSHTFGKLAATAGEVTVEQLLSVIEPECARIDRIR